MDQTVINTNFWCLWYEFYPNAAVYLPGIIGANANDSLYTSVNETNVSAHTWQIYTQDFSLNEVYDKSFTFNEASSTHNVAEAITEFPDGSGAIPHFAGVTFSGVNWIDSFGGVHSLSSAHTERELTVTASNITNCIKLTNQSSTGFQTNYIVESSCPN